MLTGLSPRPSEGLRKASTDFSSRPWPLSSSLSASAGGRGTPAPNRELLLFLCEKRVWPETPPHRWLCFWWQWRMAVLEGQALGRWLQAASWFLTLAEQAGGPWDTARS